MGDAQAPASLALARRVAGRLAADPAVEAVPGPAVVAAADALGEALDGLPAEEGLLP